MNSDTLSTLIELDIEAALDRYDETLRQIIFSAREGLIDYIDAAYLTRTATRKVNDRLLWVIWEDEERRST